MPSSRTITPVTPSLSSARAENLVFHVTLFLLSVIGFFVLLRLPRAFARFWRPSEWLTGHIFWHTSFRPQRARGVYAKNLAGNYSSETGSTSETKQAASDDSHTLYVHDKNNKGQQQVQTEFDLPPHIATCPAFLQRLVMLHRVRISPGFSVSQAVIMICYFATLIYAGCYKSSPFSDPVRAGWVAVSQLPIVIALATKNNIIGTLMGFTYEKLNYLHRFIGQLIVIAANIHSLGYFYKWSIGGTFQASISTPHIIWGLVGLVALDCIFFFSLSFWRNRYHNIMLPVHIIGLVIAIPAIWMHKPSTMRWMCACIGIYGFDHVCRFIKTRISTATIRPLPEMNSTRVEVPYINGGWRAGQHVRLRVLTFGLGWFGWTEAHPFTIASVADGEEGIILLVKKSGRWTGRLYDMAKSSGFTEAGQGRRVKVMVEGPYGSFQPLFLLLFSRSTSHTHRWTLSLRLRFLLRRRLHSRRIRHHLRPFCDSRSHPRRPRRPLTRQIHYAHLVNPGPLSSAPPPPASNVHDPRKRLHAHPHFRALHARVCEWNEAQATRCTSAAYAELGAAANFEEFASGAGARSESC
ncbi:hypothetical protein H2248_003211 [Termitomyces sp. 'cryptogamus']|nr:hypothetical protein H2248_003211 [Termitomyces sp. 'cryptogamus']